MDIENYAILDGYAKAENVLRRSYTALCSISGGSDSDIMLDIIHNLDEDEKVTDTVSEEISG
jgi:predicted phosphoadenosine phosphosulfate sulfurtransferase